MSTMMTYQFLEPRAKSAYRQLFIKGSRIRAEIVYRACTALDELCIPDDEERRTPEQVAQTIVCQSRRCWRPSNTAARIRPRSPRTTIKSSGSRKPAA